ncbi:hypothetical protein ABID21_000379 [Pseudorhizobium tarimense]|uniref:Uncharacterized protein n=1 Tax=Pseudorhizobium tarimense TaxID=1079109 RepID=A0ABV2H1U4_9HYPH|nr:hypothetical protein [Pseudorhizobium tarimense]MCJ8517608.1 hypothetical protein [Pseudorhizobium tarimense]
MAWKALIAERIAPGMDFLRTIRRPFASPALANSGVRDAWLAQKMYA